MKRAASEAVANLARHPGWQELRDLLQERQQQRQHLFGQQAMAGTILDQREVDFLRGFYAGARWVFDVPAKDLRLIDEAADRAAKE